MKFAFDKELNWEDMQISKIKTKSYSKVFYRMADLKISENSQESICGGALFQ